jgi:cytochrome P450
MSPALQTRIGYGAPGPHFCLGASLAGREITVMWEELLRRVPIIEVAYRRSNFMNGIKRLPARIA